MTTTKPRKRLVGKIQYLGTMGAKGLGFSLGMVLGFGGFLLMAITLVLIVMGFSFGDRQIGPMAYFGLAVGCAGLALATLWSSGKALTGAEKIGEVELITKHTAMNLPDDEILVRGSDRPDTEAQAELLRAVRQGPETSPEQLLRAAQESRTE